MLINPYIFTANFPSEFEGELPISIVTTLAEPVNSTASPTISFTSYTPIENDTIVMWSASSSGATLALVPSDWINVLGGTAIATPGDGTLAITCLAHIITATEASTGTTSWTFSGMWNTPEVGETIAVIIRGVNTTNPINAATASFNASPVATHVLAEVSGASLDTGSLVLSGVFPDNLQTYTTPAGWSSISATTGTNQGGHVFMNNNLTIAGTSVSPTDIIPSSTDEYASITVALRMIA